MIKKASILFPFLVGLFFEVIAQPVQFKVPIVFHCGSQRDTLWIGISGDGPGGKILDNTYGPDFSKAYGRDGEWCEQLYPPDLPFEDFLAKFMDIPGRSQMQNGMRPFDFRGFTSISQIDSFAIRVYGDSVAKGPLKVTWSNDLKSYGNFWRLLKKQGPKYTTVVKDMTTATSYTDPNEGFVHQLNYLLIKTGVVSKVRQKKGS